MKCKLHKAPKCKSGRCNKPKRGQRTETNRKNK